MEILWFKGLAVLIIVMTAIVGGMVSIRIGVSSRAERLLPLGDAFAGCFRFHGASCRLCVTYVERFSLRRAPFGLSSGSKTVESSSTF